MKYRKKPIVIDAIIWNGNNLKEVMNFVNSEFRYEPLTNYVTKKFTYSTMDNDLRIVTLEGLMKASIGDYIIKGVNGEYYPCKPDIFEKTYEKVDDMINTKNTKNQEPQTTTVQESSPLKLKDILDIVEYANNIQIIYSPVSYTYTEDYILLTDSFSQNVYSSVRKYLNYTVYSISTNEFGDLTIFIYC